MRTEYYKEGDYIVQEKKMKTPYGMTVKEFRKGEGGGSGYRQGLIFKIRKVEKWSGQDHVIYWPDTSNYPTDCGIYDCLTIDDTYRLATAEEIELYKRDEENMGPVTERGTRAIGVKSNTYEIY